MNGYLSHYSAAFTWNIPYLEFVLSAEATNRHPDADGERSFDITFSDKCDIRKKKNQITHLCSYSLPGGAVQKRGDLFVSSPELLFIQLAEELSFHHLILLGLQLCSHPPGKPAEAITSEKKLSAFIKKISGCKGYQNACLAIKYIEDGSASLMESIAFMILSLPHTLGGFGLSGACFNHEIELPTNIRKQLKQSKCYVDMYYSQEKVAVEYDSFAQHNSPAQQAKDMLRASALERMGMTVIRFGTIQLYDRKACEEFVRNLAGRLGRRIRIRAKDFETQHARIRSLLPRNKSENPQPNKSEDQQPNAFVSDVKAPRPGTYL